MNGYWDIVVFGVIAAVLLWRLRHILGTRSEADPAALRPFDPKMKNKDKDKDKAKDPNSLDALTASKDVLAASPVNWSGNLPNYDITATATAHHRMIPFASVAPDFRPDDFMDKAKKTFVIIVSAYAAGDRNALEMLLSPSLFQVFAAQIEKRKTGDVYQMQLHGIKSAMITDAHLNGTQAEITVDFRAEQTILSRNETGSVIGVQDGTKRLYHDRWVFAKNLKDGPEAKWLVVRTEELNL